MFRDFYEILGIDPSATRDEIKRAFRLRVREAHPDLHPDHISEQTEETRLLYEAYKTLSDVRKRRLYDGEWSRYYRAKGAVRREGGDEEDVEESRLSGSKPKPVETKQDRVLLIPFWRDQRVLLAVLIALIIVLLLDVYFTYFRGRIIGRAVLREIALSYEYALGQGFRERASRRHLEIARSRAQSDPEARLWQLRRALELDPANFSAGLETSRTLVELGRFEESLMIAHHGLGMIESRKPEPTDDEEKLKGIRLELVRIAARASQSLGRLGEAHGYLLILNDIESGNERAELDLAIVELGLNLITTARERLERFIADHPASDLLPRATAELARAYLQTGDYQGVIEIASGALKKAPGDAAMNLLIGEAYFNLDDPELAARHLEFALPQAPDPVMCHQLLASSYLRSGEPEKAVYHFQAVLQAQRNSFEAHLGLGDAYLALGDIEAARGEYFIAAQIDPQNPEAREALSRIPRVAEEVEEESQATSQKQ